MSRLLFLTSQTHSRLRNKKLHYQLFSGMVKKPVRTNKLVVRAGSHWWQFERSVGPKGSLAGELFDCCSCRGVIPNE